MPIFETASAFGNSGLRAPAPGTFSPKSPRLARPAQSGIALLACLFALLLITGIGFGLVYLADTETGINDNLRSSIQGYAAARGGVEEARDRMRPTAPAPLALPTQMPSGTGGVLYLVNPAGNTDAVQPWLTTSNYFDNELCHEHFAGLGLSDPGRGVNCSAAPAGSTWYSSAASTAPLANTKGAMSYKWVRVTYKGNTSSTNAVDPGGAASTQICWNGSTEVLLPAGIASCDLMGQVYRPVYLLTALAVTPTGARRMLQMEAVQLRMPPLPAGLTLDGAAPTYGAPTSNGFHVSGTDLRSCGGPALPAIPAVGAWDNSSVGSIVSAIPNNRDDHYTGSGGSIPDVENLNSTNSLDPKWQTVGGLNDMVSLITGFANQIVTGPVSSINLGSDSNPQITVVNGDLTLGGGASGAGILLVTGNLNLAGLVAFDGVVLVIGNGTVNVSGGGGGQFDGAFFVAKTVDANGNPLPANSAPGAPVVNWSGGGGNGIYYDSCWVNKLQNNFYYIPIAVHEL